ncbi:MAG TPA: hypothetical protein VN372_09475 [Methanospirillum sp.]|nr:hypothetical protein [Methanospirillum sp.]
MSNIAEEIEAMLAPVIGSGLASSAIQMQCKKIGILPEELSEQNLDLFAERFEKIIRIFAGEDVASTVRRKIKELSASSGC